MVEIGEIPNQIYQNINFQNCFQCINLRTFLINFILNVIFINGYIEIIGMLSENLKILEIVREIFYEKMQTFSISIYYYFFLIPYIASENLRSR